MGPVRGEWREQRVALDEVLVGWMVQVGLLAWKLSKATEPKQSNHWLIVVIVEKGLFLKVLFLYVVT